MLKTTTFILLFLISFNIKSKTFFVYSIDHEIPSGRNGTKELPKKNFYLNIGKLQGVDEGTILQVRRKISKNNKFSNSSEHIFHVKIGLLRVIQANENSSIAINENETTDESEFPIMDYSTVMLGDEVTVPID